MRYFFAGHTTFGNRGCEALIRSTIGLIRERIPDARFVVPSSNPVLDAGQWPEAPDNGVEFVKSHPFPSKIKWWNRVSRVLKAAERTWVPRYHLEGEERQALAASDVMIMSGGDVLSLDYGLASLYDWTGVAENAIALKKQVVLWAASVGPFNAKPWVERHMVDHLRTYSSISVRESATQRYLQERGVKSKLVADPAFTLVPEPFPAAGTLAEGSEGCLGLNVSPLIRGYRPTEAAKTALDQDVVAFIDATIEHTGLDILLIPHVGPLDGVGENSDYEYMKRLLERTKANSKRVRLAPPNLNAAQLKYLISLCRYFIGARTHATIGAFSTGVPTISIAYSVKARGINEDLFGGLDFVVDTPKVTRQSLTAALDVLASRESEIKEVLNRRIPEVKVAARSAVDHMLGTLEPVSPA